MNIRKQVKYLDRFLLVCMFLLSGNADGQVAEIGNYPIYNFSPKEYGALAQNWCAVQDKRGIMYFGNTQGVLEYDGENWTIIKPINRSPVHSMAVDNEGRVFYGSENEFGFLVPDSIGQMKCFSISDMLDEEYKNFNEIWETHSTKNGIVFQSYQYIFIWQNDSLKVIASDEEIQESFYVGGKLFINFTESQLGYLEGDSIFRLKSSKISAKNSIYGMIEISSGNILIITRTDGYYKLNYPENNPALGVISKVITKNDPLFTSAVIFNTLRIGPNKISLGTWGNGTIIIDTLFNVLSIIDKDAGLQDQIIQGQFKDETGNLWLTLSNGISKVETNSELTQYNDIQGLEGTIQSISRFNKRIYVSTNVGLFFMDFKYYNKEISNFKKPVFNTVEGFDLECWDMITYQNRTDEVLIVATNNAVFEVTKDHKKKKIIDDDVYDLYQSRLDPNRIYIGLESGLTSIYRKNGTWLKEEKISGINEKITNLSEDRIGNLWIGTEEEGVLKLNIKKFEGNRIAEYSISRFNTKNGLPEGPYIVSQFTDAPTVATSMGLFKFDALNEYFKPDTTYGDQFSDGNLYIHRISEFSEPEIWMVTFSESAEYKYEVGYLAYEMPNYYTWFSEPFRRLSEDLIHAVYQESSGDVWLGGSQGLFHFQKDTTINYGRAFNAYIRSVELSNGGLIFGGTYMDDNKIQSLNQPESLKPLLLYKDNSLIFTYSAQVGGDESFTRYSYFLQGNDKTWSEWTPESKKEYTNLREGEYIFRVKAKNIYEHISKEADYEFEILAPWYRKIWAFIIYVIIAFLVVYMIVKVYTRQLRGIIRERTAEVVSQKEVIEEKNKGIMDSILYAERIQRAMLSPEDDLNKLGVDGFILFLPRDIVSGDFYWLSRHDGKLVTVAADCTGHGVPGALMSMLGVAFLNNIVGTQGIHKPSEILNSLREEVIAALNQKGSEGEQKDGMDMALHIIDFDKMTIEFSGANNPLILIRDNEIIQVKGDRMPISIHEFATESFKNHEMEAFKGDVLYTFSDGFQDQFGGVDNKKYMIKKLKDLFLDIHQRPMSEQKEILKKEFHDWTVPYHCDQIDDIIIIGVRI